MKIGLTYDLRSEYLARGFTLLQSAEFDRDDTIDAIEAGLGALGHEVDRIGNAYQLAKRLVGGERWDLVFNIAEGLRGVAREATVPAFLELYDVPYTFSDPLVSAVTLHKGMTKRIVRDAGLPTPDFAVVQSIEDVENVTFAEPWFVKPVAEGTGKGVDQSSIIHSINSLRRKCSELIEKFEQPVLVEQFLPGREFTVGILGTGKFARAVGTLEIRLHSDAEVDVYSYLNKEECEKLVTYKLVDPQRDPTVAEAEELALASWKVLGCRDAGRVDLRCNRDGRVNFIEVNPPAGLHPEHSDLPILCAKVGMPFSELLRRIVESASMRIRERPKVEQ